MRLPFVTMCVATAACLVSARSHAEPSATNTTKRHSRSAQNNEEERVTAAGVELLEGAFETETEQLKLLLNAKTPPSELLASALEKAQSEDLTKFLTAWTGIRSSESVMKTVEAQNLKKLLGGWTPPVESIASESKSRTERLQHWLNGDQSPYELFKALGIHKAADKTANSLLVAYNLEKWSRCMKFYDNTYHDDLKRTLLGVLKTYCGDEYRAKLFFDRLSILRRKTDPTELMWLVEEKTPKEVWQLMINGEAEDELSKWTKLPKWVTYVDAFNDVYPQQRTTLLAALPYPEETLVNMVYSPNLRQIDARKRVKAELINSWYDERLSPAEVCKKFGLLPKQATGYDFPRFADWVKKYLSRWNRDNNLPQEQYILVLRREYSWDELKDLLRNADKSSDLAEALAHDIPYFEKNENIGPPQKQ